MRFVYDTLCGVPLTAQFLPAKDLTCGSTLIYLHGGGLILGDKNDLPQSYRDQIHAAGHHLLLLDYPLAPEADLTLIHATLAEALDWFLTHYHSVLKLSSPNYYLFGRSAGAYLALLLSHKCPSMHQKGLISFYGFSDLTLPELSAPSAYYQSFPTQSDPSSYLSNVPLVSASVKSRYPLYIHYRQTGTWFESILKRPHLMAQYSLSKDDLARLPRTFITASTTDKDVPFSASEHLAAHILDATFHPVENQYHDFDRDENNPIAKEVYAHLIDWLTLS